MADYVVATKAQFEVPAITLLNEMVASISHSGYGYAGPFAFCQPALVQPPAGSDLLDAWQIYYRIASRLSIPLKINNWRSKEISETPPIDPVNEPTTEQIYDLMCRGSAVPIEEVRKYPDGHIFEQARETVQPRDSDCNDRFELANLEMLEQLRVVRTEDPVVRRKTDRNFPFQLIPSRMQNSQNTSVRIPGVLKSGYNPLFMNPEDMERLALKDGDQVGIRSRHGQVSAFVGQDVGLRRGVVALMHGFGGLPGPDYDPRRDGTNVNQLTDWTDDNDPYMGMPRMGALPVAVTRIDRAAADVHTEA
jgi:anaerobic selenocysteine-containing dehydrogenase